MTALSEGQVRDVVEFILERALDTGFDRVHHGIPLWQCRYCDELAESVRLMNHKGGCQMEPVTRLQYGPRDAEDWSAEAQVNRLTALLLPDLQAQLQQAQARAEARVDMLLQRLIGRAEAAAIWEELHTESRGAARAYRDVRSWAEAEAAALAGDEGA